MYGSAELLHDNSGVINGYSIIGKIIAEAGNKYI